MAETLVENGICASCGSEVRDGSSYCFNCGGSVMPEPLPPAILKPPTGTLNGRDQKIPEFLDPEPPPVAVPAMPLESPPPAAKAPSKKTFPAAGRELRRREKKTVEIEWVERPPSAAAFIVAAVLLALMVAGLIAAAAYLR